MPYTTKVLIINSVIINVFVIVDNLSIILCRTFMEGHGIEHSKLYSFSEFKTS